MYWYTGTAGSPASASTLLYCASSSANGLSGVWHNTSTSGTSHRSQAKEGSSDSKKHGQGRVVGAARGGPVPFGSAALVQVPYPHPVDPLTGTAHQFGDGP